MSTKTLRKRIALVAVATLGAGVLSVAPAHAADPTITVTASSVGATTVGTISGVSQAAGGVVTLTAPLVMSSTGQLNLAVAAGDGITTLTVSGGVFSSVTGGMIYTGGTSIKSGTLATPAGGAMTAVIVKPTGVGVMKISSFDGSDTTATTTQTWSVVAPTTVGTLDASKSYASIKASGASPSAETNAVASNADVDLGFKVANGQQGLIAYSLNDTNGNSMPTSTIVSATATGGAVVAFSSAAQVGASVSGYYPGTVGNIYVAQGAANTAMSTVVTISVNGAPWVTKALTLVGPVASITLAAATAGVYGETGDDTGAISVVVKDSLGVRISDNAVTWDAASYNASVTSYSAVSYSTTTLGGTSNFTCSTTAGKTKATAYLTNTAGAKITSNTLDIHCVGGAYSYAASLDKASYVPGDIATLTITAKDSAGNAASDASTVGAGAAIAGSNMTAVTALATTDTFTAGVKKYTFIVGSTEGSYSMSVSLTAIDDAVTVPYSIKGSSTAVSNADVLKAIVSLIASINKQIAALQKALLKK